MLKKILLFLFILVSTFTFSQNIKVEVTPFSIKNNSEVIKISTSEKGLFEISFIRKNDGTILFTNKVFINNQIKFKHNFYKYPKGEYFFIVKNKNKEILKVLKEK